MKGYESKIVLCLFCQGVINTNLLTFVRSKKMPHPSPPFVPTPSNTHNQTHTPPTRPSLLPYHTRKHTNHYCNDFRPRKKEGQGNINTIHLSNGVRP